MDLVLLGQPGAGKSTIAGRIIELTRGLYKHVDVLNYLPADLPPSKASEEDFARAYDKFYKDIEESNQPLIIELTPRRLEEGINRVLKSRRGRVIVVYLYCSKEKCLRDYIRRGRGISEEELEKRLAECPPERVRTVVSSLGVPLYEVNTENILKKDVLEIDELELDKISRAILDFLGVKVNV